MYKKKNILVIIPARGGSKGLSKKNLKKINNISLIEHVSKVLGKVYHIDRIIVSTDNEQIKKEAEKFGLSCPFKRPNFLSGDKVAIIDVLKHELSKIEKKDSIKYDVIVLLEPTSPLRKPKDVNNAIKKLIDQNYSSLWSISKLNSKFHPSKQLTIENENIKYYNSSGKNIIARQQLSSLYYRNGVVYVFTREFLKKRNRILDKDTGYILIKSKQISIDDGDDLLIARDLMKNHKY